MLRTDNINERYVHTSVYAQRNVPVNQWLVRIPACLCFFRTAWVQKIKVASEEFIETEKKKRDKVYQGLCLHSKSHIRVT